MKTTHPRPQQNRLIHYGAIIVSLIMLIAAILQLLLAVIVTPGMIFFLTAIITLLLIPFVLMITTATHDLTLADDGLTIEPVIWKSRFVPWSQVAAVKPYTLLPQRDAETTRRALVGRNKYQAAEGIMLVIPGLPLPYRIIGFLAGEGGKPVIAVTNRTHTEYEAVVEHIKNYTGQD